MHISCFSVGKGLAPLSQAFREYEITKVHIFISISKLEVRTRVKQILAQFKALKRKFRQNGVIEKKSRNFYVKKFLVGTFQSKIQSSIIINHETITENTWVKTFSLLKILPKTMPSGDYNFSKCFQ